MACSFSPSSSATRLQAVDAAAAGVKNGRVPLNLKASVAPAQQRSLGLGCCRATARQEGATQEPNVAVSSARAQLDLLEQLTSPTPEGIAGLENGVPIEPRRLATIREQLSALASGKVVDEFTLPLGKKLKEGLKRLNKLTVSQRRNIKRQALLTQVRECVAPSPPAADVAEKGESSAAATKEKSPAAVEGASHAEGSRGRGGDEETAGDGAGGADGKDLTLGTTPSLDEV